MKRFVFYLSIFACLIWSGCGGGAATDQAGNAAATGILGLLGGLFVAWSFPFWVLLIACILFEFKFVESHEPDAWGATVVFVITAVLMLLCGNRWFFQWMNEGGWSAWAKLIAFAIAPGIPWFFFKWKLWTLKCRRRFLEEKHEWIRKHSKHPADSDKVPEDLRGEWTEYLNNRSDLYPEAPRYLDHKKRIMAWGMYWPFSILATLLKDLLWEFWQHVVDWCGKTLDQMSKASYQGVDSDVDKSKLQSTRRNRW